MKIRKITSLTASFAFILMLLTSVILYVVPQGRVAYWADWRFLGLSKTEWGNLHINLGLLFLIALVLHIYYNWKPLMSYLKDKARKMKVFTSEFNVALVITILFIIGTYFLAAPFSWVMNLNDHFKDRGPFSDRQLRELTAADCAKIFAQDLQNPPVKELMQHFAAALNDLGQYLSTNFDGDFDNLIAAAGASVNRFIEILIKMPYFNDVEIYDNVKVAFYKRAQLAAADLALAFKGDGRGHFNDLDRLTIFADNLVPHVLRVDHILTYDDSLLERINAGKLIPPGSKEEVEIRACAVHAVELLKNELQSKDPRITSSNLDYLLWNRGQKPHYKAIPRHRTRTVFY